MYTSTFSYWVYLAKASTSKCFANVSAVFAVDINHWYRAGFRNFQIKRNGGAENLPNVVANVVFSNFSCSKNKKT